jgi:heme-degrading monooxygenase HmoA
MYARLFSAHVRPDRLQEFPDVFGEMILPDISREPGFKGIYVLRDAAANKIVALVLWESEADAQASVTGYLRQRRPKMAELMAGEPEVETMEVVLRA